MDLGTIILETGQVTLRPTTLGDAQALAKAAGESRENYRLNPVPNGLQEAQAHINQALRQREAGERYPLVIIWQGTLVGTTSYCEYRQWDWHAGCDLQRHGTPDVVEIGYTWLAHSAQRTGCNTQTKLLLLQYAFETWKVHRVSLRTDQRNERSRRAIERLGAKFEGIRRADKPAVDCTARDSAFYSIIIAEWPGIKDRLLCYLAV